MLRHSIISLPIQYSQRVCNFDCLGYFLDCVALRQSKFLTLRKPQPFNTLSDKYCALLEYLGIDHYIGLGHDPKLSTHSAKRTQGNRDSGNKSEVVLPASSVRMHKLVKFPDLDSMSPAMDIIYSLAGIKGPISTLTSSGPTLNSPFKGTVTGGSLRSSCRSV